MRCHNKQLYGMYILCGPETAGHRRQIYIGQSRDINKRLYQHAARKEFWTEVIIFSLTEGQFTNDQIRYLEYLGIKTSIECGHSSLMENCQMPLEPFMEEEAKTKMFSIFNDIKLLLEFAGYKIFTTQIFKLDDFTIESQHNVMSRIVKEYQSKHMYQTDDEYDMNDEDLIVKYIAKGEDYIAEAMELKDGKIMIMKGGYASHNIDFSIVSKYINENDINDKTFYIENFITVDDIGIASIIICGELKPEIWHKNYSYT